MSEKFNRGILPDVARTLKATKGDSAVALQIPINCSRKNGIGGGVTVSNTIMARDYKGIGNQEMTAVAIPVLTPDRVEKRQNGRRFKDNNEEMFTLTAQDKHGVALGVLRNVRSEYGKEIRKDYEVGNLNISRHEFLEHEIREDGITNTLDSVQKDNYLAVQVEPNENEHEGMYVQLSDDLTVYAVWYEKYQCYIAIRKLTPRECFRLQGWTDDYFEKAQFVNSDSQLYRQAGNGVSVPVVYDIAKELKAGGE